MSVKLISFTISDPVKFAGCVEEIICEEYLKLSDSTYLMSLPKNIDLLRRELAYYLDKSEELFICKLRQGEWISFHLGSRKKWIEEKV